MSTKSMIVIGTAATILSAALVFNGVAHLRTVNSVQASSQIPVVAPLASGSANASTPQIEVPPAAATGAALTDAQPNVPGAAALQPAEPEQDVAADAGSMDQTDEDAASEDVAQPITIPAGTRLTVRIGESLGSTISQVGQTLLGQVGSGCCCRRSDRGRRGNECRRQSCVCQTRWSARGRGRSANKADVTKGQRRDSRSRDFRP
jgi:hypothetical protein